MKKEIITSRFVLREFRPADVDQFIAYQTDPEFAVFHHETELGDAHGGTSSRHKRPLCRIAGQDEAPGA